MNELVIKTHDFERSKNQLKAFLEQNPQGLELLRVDISGGFLGWGDHKVTGNELNSLTTQIQDYLINFNTLHTNFIKEFGQVYRALEALDKDYIQAILIAVKAAEKANYDIMAAQSDITKTIEIQKKTIYALKQFKEKIDNYRHLGDIDEMWNDSQRLQKDIATVSNNVANATVAFKEKTQELKSLQNFKEQIDKIKHLKDVDDIWKRCNTFELYISSAENSMDTYRNQIEVLQSAIQEIQEKSEVRSKLISKKLKAAYILAGGSIGIAIIEFGLFLMRIL